MKNPHIFVALSTFSEFDPEPLKLLEESGCAFSFNKTGRRIKEDEIIGMAGNAQGIIAGVEPYDRRVLDNLPNLRCISRCGVGIDSIDMQCAREKGIAVRNTPDAVVQPVAELTIAMIFDLLRKLTEQTVILKAHQWKKVPGNLLSGRKVGILGLGRIGKRVAELLVALGAQVFAADIAPDTGWARDKKVTIKSVDELLTLCDVVSIHVSVSGKSGFILNNDRIALMKQGAIVINTSRGSCIDEAALYEGIHSGHLGGAGLDVFDQEPYDGKLTALTNVVLTPHIATLTRESRTQMEIEAVKNLLVFLKKDL
jgi:D-3-phosphoglycerate dehydrogenase